MRELSFTLQSHLPDYLRDAEEIVRAFFPYVKIAVGGEPLALVANLTDGVFSYSVSSVLGVENGSCSFDGDYLQQKKYSKRLYKNLLYDYLSDRTGVKLPYGSLTGVRPTKLFYELTASGEDAECVLQKEFRVRSDKAKLVSDAVLSQKGFYCLDDGVLDLYVNIPFCPTRCAYCSFLSAEYPRVKKQIPDYVRCVGQELRAFREYLFESGRALRAVYVGGGTPTALTAAELAEILRQIPTPEKEFTVEAGRPDTITAEHLAVMKEVGVTRVSVNPQSFDDNVLKNIGRSHSAEDVLRAYRLVKEYGFEVNTDFIAGLAGETTEGFLKGIEIAAKLDPENITVHTLSLKRGATLTNEGAEKGEFGKVSAMTEGARTLLGSYGYRPYYMYRQKNTADNLENVGYARDGKASCYNVDIMEETTDIYAVGAGGMSKKVTRAENRLERYSNPKGLNEYLTRIAEIIEKKSLFFRDEGAAFFEQEGRAREKRTDKF